MDDSVSGVYLERYVYLIGGWSETDNVRNVQIYDTAYNTWQQATPLVGTPVFGHAGAIIGDEIIYCDGAYRNPVKGGPGFIASDECWRGRLDRNDPTNITWSRLPKHPGNARYRIAAGVDHSRGLLCFVGGTDNPYNYDGIGYDGRPSEPSATAFVWVAGTTKWEVLTTHAPASMDHRGLIAIGSTLRTIGGMEVGQSVSAHVRVLSIK